MLQALHCLKELATDAWAWMMLNAAYAHNLVEPPNINLKIHILILHSLMSHEKGSSKTAHDIRNWAYFHGNALLPTNFNKFGMFSKRKSVCVVFIDDRNYGQRCDSPMPNPLRSKENGVIQIQVSICTITQSFTRVEDEWDINTFLLLALAKA